MRKIPVIGLLLLLGVIPQALDFLVPAAGAMPPVQRMVLPNGLVLLASEEHSLPFATFHVLVDSGSRRDPGHRSGLAHLTSKGLLLGTTRNSASQVNEALDFMGASLRTSCQRDFATLTLRVLKKDLDQGLDLLVKALTSPIFPEEEVRREKDIALGTIESEEDDPGKVADKAFHRRVFGTGPYGNPETGTRESVAALTREQMVEFHRTYYRPNNAILVVVGDVSVDELRDTVVPRFSLWPKGDVPKEAYAAGAGEGEKVVKIDRPITQANVIIGEGGVSRDNPDYYALTVMNHILGGGGFSSRLVEEVRNKRGLAYSVTCFFEPNKYPGTFQILLQTKNASAREAVSLAVAQMERIRREPVSDKELAEAKQFLVGSFPMRMDTQTKLSSFLAQVEYFGLGLDYPVRYPSLIQAVTKADVLRVAQAYLHPEDRILVVVANLKEAGFVDP
jgi:zinc protease